jgi:hypothetical protein
MPVIFPEATFHAHGKGCVPDVRERADRLAVFGETAWRMFYQAILRAFSEP